MTTSYSDKDFSNFHYINTHKRNGILKDSASPIYLLSIVAHSSHLPVGLAVFTPVHDYNLHIGRLNKNAQQKACYTSNQRSDCYWWPLFSFLLDAATLNAYILYILDSSTSASSTKLSRLEFIHYIATSLTQNPSGNRWIHQPKISVTTQIVPLVLPPKHDWIYLDKKQYSQPCRSDNTKPSFKRGAEPLAEITLNGQKRCKQGSQTMWACSGYDTPCYKRFKCWNAIHARVREIEIEEVDKL